MVVGASAHCTRTMGGVMVALADHPTPHPFSGHGFSPFKLLDLRPAQTVAAAVARTRFSAMHQCSM